METSLHETHHGSTLATALRGVGALVLMGSAGTFLAQNIAQLQGIERYGLFLGLTAFIAAAGVLCALKIKESKGARTLFGVSTTFLPVHFVFLGALFVAYLYGTSSSIPGIFTVARPSSVSLVGTFIVALPILAFVAFAGLSSLARVSAKTLTFEYLILNALLLLPTRGIDSVALLFVGGSVFAMFAEAAFYAPSALMNTREAKCARVIVVSPLLLLLGRNIALYPLGVMLPISIFFVAGVIGFFVLPRGGYGIASSASAQLMGFVSLCLSWLTFAQAGVEHRHAQIAELFSIFPAGNEIALFGLPLAALALGLSGFTRQNAPSYRRFGAWTAVTVEICQLLATGGYVNALLCLAISAAILCGSFVSEERGLFFSGVVGVTVGFLYHIYYAVLLVQLSAWVSLALFGVTAIVVSSVLERRYSDGVKMLQSFRVRLSQWR